MEVKLISSMGDDIQIVNAARCSFGKKSKWEIKYDSGLNPVKKLSKADQGLIQFLARGCTSGDWDALVDELEYVSGYFTKEGREVEDLLNYVKKMPDHWTPFGHTAITLHIKAPIFVARQLG